LNSNTDGLKWISIAVQDYLGGDYYGDYLPNDDAYQFPGTALLPYWSDEYVYAGGADSVTYEINGAVGSRTVAFHWATQGKLQGCGIFDFYAVFQEAVPNQVTYFYDTIFLCNNQAGLVGASSPNGKSEHLSLSGPSTYPLLSINRRYNHSL